MTNFLDITLLNGKNIVHMLSCIYRTFPVITNSGVYFFNKSIVMAIWKTASCFGLDFFVEVLLRILCAYCIKALLSSPSESFAEIITNTLQYIMICDPLLKLLVIPLHHVIEWICYRFCQSIYIGTLQEGISLLPYLLNWQLRIKVKD